MRPLFLLAAAMMLAACGSDAGDRESGPSPVQPIEPPPPGTEVVLIWDEQNWDQADWQ